MKRSLIAVFLIAGLSTLNVGGQAQEQPTQAAPGPRLVSVHLLIVDLAPQITEGGKAGPGPKQLDEKEFAGSQSDIQEKLTKLMSDGVVASKRAVMFTAVENLPTLTAVGEMSMYITRAEKSEHPGGGVRSQAGGRDTGTTAKALVRVGEDKSVTIDLEFQDTRPNVPGYGPLKMGPGKFVPVYGVRPTYEAGAPAVKNDTTGQEFQVYDFITHSLKTKLTIPPGQGVVAQGIKSDAKSGEAKIMLIVSARLLKPDGKAGK